MLVVTVSVAGFVTYFIIPAVPPWLASRQGALPHTTRVEYEVWSHLGLPAIAKVFNGSTPARQPGRGAAVAARRVAAHGAAVHLADGPPRPVGVPRLPRRSWSAVLVYGAEHYVSDILLGWAYTLVVFWAWNRHWAHRDREQESGGTLVAAS